MAQKDGKTKSKHFLQTFILRLYLGREENINVKILHTSIYI